VPDWTVPIPPGLPAGVPLYFQYLATNGLEVQLSNGLELFSGLHAPEIEVLSVAPVGTPKGGDQNHPFAVTVRNNGNQGSAFTLRVCVGNSCDNEVFTLDAGQTSTVQVAVDIPPVPTTCGVKTNFTVQAEALVTDCVPANDDLAMTLGIAAPHWDLRLEVLNAPAQTWQGSPFSWQVRVTNVGNVTSHDVCLRTAMIPVPGPNDWSAPVCLYFFDSGNVAPGASKTFHFQCTAPCFSFLGTQWIKAGLRAGCFDDCSVGNFDQDSLLVNDGC
jgi:hypothetical protein